MSNPETAHYHHPNEAMPDLPISSPDEAQLFNETNKYPEITAAFADAVAPLVGLPNAEAGAGMSAATYAAANQAKWAIEAVVAREIPTREFTSARRGVEVDVERAASFFEGVTSAQHIFGEKVGSLDGNFFLVDSIISSNLEKLLTPGENSGTVGHEPRVYSGLEDVVFLTAKYAAGSSEYQSRQFIRIVANTGYNKLLDDPRYDALRDLPAWRAAVIHEKIGPTIDRASAERRKLTDEDRAPVVAMFARYGFSEKQARSVFGAALSLEPLEKKRKFRSRGEVDAAKLNNIFLQIDKLEQHQAGTALRLHEIFGIRNFDRYAAEDLERQLDPEYTPDMIAISAMADWNGAFSRFGEQMKELSQAPLFIEAVNMFDIQEKLGNLRDANVPVSHILIGAHGTPESMTLGRKSEQKIYQTDIWQYKQVQSLVEDGLIQSGCRITLYSCNTGHEGAISESIAELPGVGSVQAPDFAPYGIAPSRDDPNVLMFKRDDSGKHQSLGNIHAKDKR